MWGWCFLTITAERYCKEHKELRTECNEKPIGLCFSPTTRIPASYMKSYQFALYNTIMNSMASNKHAVLKKADNWSLNNIILQLPFAIFWFAVVFIFVHSISTNDIGFHLRIVETILGSKKI